MAYTTINKSTDYFNTKLYNGTGSNQSITGVGFKPDWIWGKTRSSGQRHVLTDVIRGINKQLTSDSTAAETSYTNSFTAFGSDGFSVGTDNGTNMASQTQVAWNWLAGTAVSGNTGGSGSYKTYTGSVNTTSGFSIIKYTGNGSGGHTIPHHLSSIPKMIIMKRTDGGTDAWQVYHQSLGNTKRLTLQTTAAADADINYFNNTTPTSSVFTLGSSSGGNGNNYTYIAYCFAEKQGYSNFGSYVGNGNADGPFIYTGFKPAFVIIKRAIGGTDNWVMFDNKRSPFNEVNENLAANSSGSTNTGIKIDMISNGFKCRVTEGNTNVSGNTYVYMAFGQSLVGTNNIPNNAR